MGGYGGSGMSRIWRRAVGGRDRWSGSWGGRWGSRSIGFETRWESDAILGSAFLGGKTLFKLSSVTVRSGCENLGKLPGSERRILTLGQQYGANKQKLSSGQASGH